MHIKSQFRTKSSGARLVSNIDRSAGAGWLAGWRFLYGLHACACEPPRRAFGIHMKCTGGLVVRWLDRSHRVRRELAYTKTCLSLSHFNGHSAVGWPCDSVCMCVWFCGTLRVVRLCILHLFDGILIVSLTSICWNLLNLQVRRNHKHTYHVIPYHFIYWLLAFSV